MTKGNGGINLAHLGTKGMRQLVPWGKGFARLIEHQDGCGRSVDRGIVKVRRIKAPTGLIKMKEGKESKCEEQTVTVSITS